MSHFGKAILFAVFVFTCACTVNLSSVLSSKENSAKTVESSQPGDSEGTFSTESGKIKNIHEPPMSSDNAYQTNHNSIWNDTTETSSDADPEIKIEQAFDADNLTKAAAKATYYDLTPKTDNAENPFSQEFQSVKKAGLLLPLSGKAKATGAALQSAAVMALTKAGNKSFTLQFYDTKGTADGAYSAAKAALNDDVDIILGPLFSFETAEVANAIGWQDINAISFSSDPENLSENIFSIAPLLTEQVTKIIDFACTKGYKRFAIVAQNNKMGEYVFSAAKNAAESETCGGQITATSFYEPNTTDFSQTIKEILPEAMLVKLERERLKEQGYEVINEPLYDSKGKLIDENNIVFDFDAVLLVDEGLRLRSLGAMLEYYDVVPDKVKILGTSTFDDPKVKKERSFRKAWFTTLPDNNFTKFTGDYKTLTGSKTAPPRIASLVYDSVALVAKLAKQDSLDTQTLTDSNGYSGIDGKFRFLPDGRVERALTIVELDKNGKTKVLRRAPLTFSETIPDPVKPRELENIKPELPESSKPAQNAEYSDEESDNAKPESETENLDKE